MLLILQHSNIYHQTHRVNLTDYYMSISSLTDESHMTSMQFTLHSD